MKALVIITLQNDFCSFGNAAIDAADNLVEVANSIMPFFDKIVAVNFSFPPNHLSFAANHLFRQPGKSMMINGRIQLLKAMHCVEGSFGAEFPISLNKQEIDFIQKVGTDFDVDIYSIFRDLDANDNVLSAYLRAEGITSLYFMGIGAVFFENSIVEAQQKGFNVLIVKDATVNEFNDLAAELISIDEIH
jgi:nicotinamidase/pyrazinamidase